MSNTIINIENYKCYIIKCGNININIKKLSLVFIFSSTLFLYQQYRTYVYIPIISFICSLVLFWNYPILILFTNSRPMYYEDLFIYDWNVKYINIEKNIKNRFENIFNIILIISNSIFISALSDYLFYETKEKTSYVEVIGITGGIFKIFQIVNHINGSILLYITRRILLNKIKKEKSIELTRNIGVNKNNDSNRIVSINNITNNVNCSKLEH